MSRDTTFVYINEHIHSLTNIHIHLNWYEKLNVKTRALDIKIYINIYKTIYIYIYYISMNKGIDGKIYIHVFQYQKCKRKWDETGHKVVDTKSVTGASSFQHTLLPTIYTHVIFIHVHKHTQFINVYIHIVRFVSETIIIKSKKKNSDVH